MGGDDGTLEFYTREAEQYAEFAAGHSPTDIMDAFADLVPAGGSVLDFGCGSAWAANRFQEMGFVVSGFDGSAGLAEQARARYGIDVAVGRFEEFYASQAYDGIWASFCLLHDSRAALPGHLTRLQQALRPDGVLYVGLIMGDGEQRDGFGRLYTYFSEAELRTALERAGFMVLDVTSTPGKRYDGAPIEELHLYARKA
ncbi:MAG: class I SAM-dependent methyltransferase [Pseudomonadota bacterium]